MTTDNVIKFVGGTGSPYTQKMLALMRYRQIPYSVIWGQPADYCAKIGVEPPKPTFMPTFFFEDGGQTSAHCDSTPIIRRLEADFTARSVLPRDPALAFIDYLIEDFGDEWCTKYMFHYRWHFDADAENAASLLPLSMNLHLSPEQYEQYKAYIKDRQVNRLYVVGSNDITAPMIDASYRRFLQAMENHLKAQGFMLGNRPAAGDFGIYGQLTQLITFDPTPRAIAHEISHRTVAWIEHMRDLSGIEPTDSDWVALEDQPDSLRDLLAEIGRVYAPAQIANAKAVMAGEENWTAEIDGAQWTQPTFPYQAKCLKWTNEQYQALDASARSQVDALLSGTGVEAMLSAD